MENHVWYKVDTNDSVYKYKVPLIAYPASTAKMLDKAIERSMDSTSVFTAALIKQIIHTGTDAFTKMGIAIPGATIINSTCDVENITKYVSQDSFNINSGDAIKTGVGYATANVINMLISILHRLCNIEDNNSKLYEVRTRKIILYSNEIATGSNVLKTTWELVNGNAMGVHNLDLGESFKSVGY